MAIISNSAAAQNRAPAKKQRKRSQLYQAAKEFNAAFDNHFCKTRPHLVFHKSPFLELKSARS